MRPEFQCRSLIQSFRSGQTQPSLLDMLEQHGRSYRYPIIPDDTTTQQSRAEPLLYVVCVLFLTFRNMLCSLMKK